MVRVRKEREREEGRKGRSREEKRKEYRERRIS